MPRYATSRFDKLKALSMSKGTYAVRLDGIRMSKNGRGKAEMGKAES